MAGPLTALAKALEWAKAAEAASGIPNTSKFFYDASKAMNAGKALALSAEETDRLTRAVKQGFNAVGYRYTQNLAKDQTHLDKIASKNPRLTGEQQSYHVDLTPGAQGARSRGYNVEHDVNALYDTENIHPLALKLQQVEKATDEQANQRRFIQQALDRGASGIVYSPVEGELYPGREAIDAFAQSIEQRSPGLYQPSIAVIDPSTVRHLNDAKFEDEGVGLFKAKGGTVQDPDQMTHKPQPKTANPLAAVFRGWAAGTGGLGRDAEDLTRLVAKYFSAPGSIAERYGQGEAVLPSTEFYKDWLPGKSMTEGIGGRELESLGSLAGGVGLGTAAKGVTRVGSAIAHAAPGPVGRSAQQGVVAYRAGDLTNPNKTGIFLSSSPKVASQYITPQNGRTLAAYDIPDNAKVLEATNRWKLVEDLDPSWNRENIYNRYIKQGMVGDATPEQRLQREAERRIAAKLQKQGYDGVSYKGDSMTDQAGEYQIFNPKLLSLRNGQITGPLASQAGVIRASGDNNFLKGSVENALARLKVQRPRASMVDSPETVAAWEAENPGPKALNKFVEGPLTRYVKNQMATPEDPVRALAEQGVLHFQPGQQTMTSVGAAARRQAAGFDPVGAAKTDLARGWENVSDMVPLKGTYDTHLPLAEYLTEETKADALRRIGGDFAVNNPHAPAYAFDRGRIPEDLGFDHLTDELRNALNPESGLPRNLLLTPEKLQNMGMERAVRHVAAINDWREQAALTARKAAAEGIPVRKEHEGGFRWLTVPDTAKDEKALKYACDIGKQGAWCTQGSDAAKQYGSGGNQLHVLVDAKGDPHVQVMTSPERSYGTQHLENFRQQAQDDALAAGVNPGTPDDPTAKFLSFVNDRMTALANENPQQRIVQIKGNSNFKPKDEYLPFVQDFVKSGKWSNVGDLQNTGLHDITDSHSLSKLVYDLADFLPKGGTGAQAQHLKDLLEANNASRFVSREEVLKLLDTPTPPVEGFSQGGSVYNPARVDEIIAAHRNSEYDPARVDALVAQLKEEMYA